MRTVLAFTTALALLVPLSGHAGKSLIAEQIVDIDAPPAKVWAIVKNYDALPTWHPAFKGDVIKSGQNNTVGAVRTLTLGSGESFDEELLCFSDKRMTFRYRIVGDSPFPLAKYVSSMTVGKTKDGKARIVWQGRFENKPGSGKTDGEVLQLIDGAYKSGLDNVKKLAEQ